MISRSATICRITIFLATFFVVSLCWYDGVRAGNLYLTWVDTSDNENGFKIDRIVAGLVETTLTVGANVTSYMDTGLVKGAIYCYRVRAFNSVGESPASNQPCAAAQDTNSLPVTLAVEQTIPMSGSSIQVTWSGIAAPTPSDWIGLYSSGAADTNFIDWIYVSCSKTPGSNLGAGSCAFFLPAGLAVRSYEFRLFGSDRFVRLASSNGFALGTEMIATASLAVSPASVPVGGTVFATWSDISTPSATDWIGLYLPGSPENEFLDWIYLSCSKTHDRALTSGSCSFPLALTLTPGTYELRLFTNNTFARLATSNGLALATDMNSVATLSVSETSVPVGGFASAIWTGINSPSPTDWVGLYLPNAADREFIDWMYVSCSKNNDRPLASGSCSFPLPPTLTAGNYELRLFANDAFGRLATSNKFTIAVSTPQSPVLAVSPTTASQGGAVIATWSGIFNPSPRDWIGLYVPGTPNENYLNRMYVSCSKRVGDARAAGSCSLSLPRKLPAGHYEIRLFANDSFIALANSNSFTVSNAIVTVLSNQPAETLNVEPVGPAELAADWVDYDLTVKLQSSSNGSIGVLFRYQDDRNHYRFSWNRKSKARRLEKVENGTVTVLAHDSIPYAMGQTYNLQVIADEIRLTVRIDGVQIFTVTDSTFNKGPVGLYSSKNRGSRFRDLLVQDLATGTVLLSDNFNQGDLTGWTIVDQSDHSISEWIAIDGTLVQTSNIENTFALYTARDWSDYRFNGTLRPVGTGSVGVMFRYQDDKNHYRFVWNGPNTGRRLEKVKNGNVTILAEDTTPYIVENTYNLEIIASSQSITIRIDGMVVFSIIDSEFKHGSIAFYLSYNQAMIISSFGLYDLATNAPLLKNDFAAGNLLGWTKVGASSSWSVEDGSLAGSNLSNARSAFLLYTR